jgi:hypothetical protein
MKKLYWLILIIILVSLFIPFREDLLICKVYNKDLNNYELWEKPMVRGLESYPSEDLAMLPFSLIGGVENACYTHKWYQSIKDILLLDKSIRFYSFIDRLLILRIF